jgi:hypothetical protein
MKYGGEGGIRTPDSLATMSDFESGAFNRALPPLLPVNHSSVAPRPATQVQVTGLGRATHRLLVYWLGCACAMPNPIVPDRSMMQRTAVARARRLDPIRCPFSFKLPGPTPGVPEPLASGAAQCIQPQALHRIPQCPPAPVAQPALIRSARTWYGRQR